VAWKSCLLEVGVNQDQKNGSVEELSHEYTISDGLDLGGVSIFTNPLDQTDQDESQDGVDDDDDERHGSSSHFTPELV